METLSNPDFKHLEFERLRRERTINGMEKLISPLVPMLGRKVLVFLH